MNCSAFSSSSVTLFAVLIRGSLDGTVAPRKRHRCLFQTIRVSHWAKQSYVCSSRLSFQGDPVRPALWLTGPRAENAVDEWCVHKTGRKRVWPSRAAQENKYWLWSLARQRWPLNLEIERLLTVVCLHADATWSTSGTTAQRSRTRRRWTSRPSWFACSWSCAAACWCSSTSSMTSWVQQMHSHNTHSNTQRRSSMQMLHLPGRIQFLWPENVLMWFFFSIPNAFIFLIEMASGCI